MKYLHFKSYYTEVRKSIVFSQEIQNSSTLLLVFKLNSVNISIMNETTE